MSSAIFRTLKPCQTRLCFSLLNFDKFFKRLKGDQIPARPRISAWKSEIVGLLRNRRVDDARRVFDELPHRNLDLYTVMVAGYTQNHRLEEALHLFSGMLVRDVVSWNSMMKGCLDCGNLSMARKLFDEMPQRNVVSWTTILNGFFRHGDLEKAEELFYEMPWKDVAAWNSMIHGYFSHGRVEDAQRVFGEMPSRNVISWTSMISGLEQHGKSEEALGLFRRMVGSCIRPTSNTISSALTACANIVALLQGVQVHAHALKLGYSSDAFVSPSLIAFYAKCEQMKSARMVLREQLHASVVMWTALMTGYSLNQKHRHALKVFRDMMRIGVFPNHFSFTSALNSCCAIEALDKGKQIQTVAVKLGLEKNVFVGNSLVVAYSKCGRIRDAVAAFKDVVEKNVVSWNTIIVGCAQHGLGKQAVLLFNQMICAGFEPDEITLTGLLSACNRSGMTQKGHGIFKYYRRQEGIELKLEHYACMVAILGRWGKLEEAEDLITSMPVKANAKIWLALLSACEMHNSSLKVAERAAKCVLALEPRCSPAYVMLSNLYASAGRWSDVAMIKYRMKRRGILK